MRDDANRYARPSIMFGTRSAAVLLSLSLIAAPAQAASQEAPVADNANAAPAPASVEALDDWALATAELHRLSHDPTTLSSTKPHLDRILELLDQAKVILDRRQERLDRVQENLDQSTERLDQAQERMERGLDLLDRRQELLDRRQELLDQAESIIREVRIENATDLAFAVVSIIISMGGYVIMALRASSLNRRARVAGIATTVVLIGVLCVTIPDWPSNSLMNDVADRASDVGHQLTGTPEYGDSLR